MTTERTYANKENKEAHGIDELYYPHYWKSIRSWNTCTVIREEKKREDGITKKKKVCGGEIQLLQSNPMYKESVNYMI